MSASRFALASGSGAFAMCRSSNTAQAAAKEVWRSPEPLAAAVSNERGADMLGTAVGVSAPRGSAPPPLMDNLDTRVPTMGNVRRS